MKILKIYVIIKLKSDLTDIKQLIKQLMKGFKSMEQEYLNIKDFAAAAGVTVQSIYKRLKKETDVLNNYIIIEKGVKLISSSAINEIYNNSVPKNNTNEELTAYLKDRVDEQKKELQKKDDLINNLIEQLRQQQNLLDQQQQLAALDKKKILLLEQQTEKKSIFARLFGKRERS